MRPPHLVLTLLFLASAAVAQNQSVTLEAGGRPALKLSMPSDAKISVTGDKTALVGAHLQIYVWALPEAKTVAEVVPQAGEVIKTEFVKLAVTGKETLQVLGHEATDLKGTGEEADDNDPGTAEVVIFTDGERVFAACVHGEKDAAAKQHPEFLKVLESLQKP